MCGSRKYPYSPHRRNWKFRGGGGSQRPKDFITMYEAKLEFPEGWGVIGKIPSVGGMDIFWNHTILHHVTRYLFAFFLKSFHQSFFHLNKMNTRQ